MTKQSDMKRVKEIIEILSKVTSDSRIALRFSNPLELLIATILFAVVCGFTGWTKGVWIISFAIIAWAVNWHESANLWDYLLDPFLAIWAVLAIPNAIYLKRRKKAQSGYLFRAG